MVNATFSGYLLIQKSTLSIYITIIIFVILAHISIISAIFKRNNLAKQRYYIVATISATDCCSCMVALIVLFRSIIDGYFTGDFTNYLLAGIVLASFRVSLFCTCLLSFDRYIAVSRALRYNEIITTKRILMGLSSFWILSLLLCLIPFLQKEERNIIFNNGIGMLVVNILIVFFFSIFIIYVAGYSIKVRNRHIAIIESRSTQFGVDTERLNLLQRLKGSLYDVMKLGMLTVFVIVLLLILSSLTRLVSEETVQTIRHLGFLLYTASNPVIYISVLRELRTAMKHIFCGNNRVHVERTDP